MRPNHFIIVGKTQFDIWQRAGRLPGTLPPSGYFRETRRGDVIWMIRIEVPEDVSLPERTVVLDRFAVTEVARLANGKTQISGRGSSQLSGGYPQVPSGRNRLKFEDTSGTLWGFCGSPCGADVIWQGRKVRAFRTGWQLTPDSANTLELIWSDYQKELATKPVAMPEEILDGDNYTEGAVCQVRVNAHERNRKARDACVAYYGATCSICGFDFGNIFGETLEGFIHVHHLKLLAEVTEEYQVDPKRDLRPVCPNCHAVIHSQETPLTIEEVKTLIRSAKRKSGKGNRINS